jgi:hypothetical protein
MELSIFDSHKAFASQQTWLPLESILHAYLEMIILEKIIAVPKDSEYEGPLDKQTPWIIQPSSTKILHLTLKVYDRLCKAIETRLLDSQESRSMNWQVLSA